MSIERIVAMLDSGKSLDLPALRAALQATRFDDAWMAAHCPNPMPVDGYGRDLLHTGADYEIVLATWPVGVGTQIHNHGAYSSYGMVRVLKGEIFNHVYAPDGVERVKLLYRESYVAGGMIEVPKGLLHCMGNARTDGHAMSLHVYSPRIVDVTYWDRETQELVGALVG